MVGHLKVNGWIKTAIAALAMVLYDVVLEPFAIAYGMWSWDGVLPPFQNFLAWYVIAFCLFVMVWKANLKMNNLLAWPLYLVQVVFFAILYFI
jgi:putative membrane protein